MGAARTFRDGEAAASPGGPLETKASAGASAGRGTPFSHDLQEFRRDFDARLAAFLAERRERVADPAGDGLLVAAVAGLALAGGKRLRPALVWHAHRACGGDRGGAARTLGLAVEVLHTYLLVHDDIMDGAETRRARPTVHATFRERHREAGWPGDPEAFGRTAAILAGDLAHSWAVELFDRAVAEAGRDEGVARALERAFHDTCEEVVRGQLLEVMLPYRDAPDDEDLLRALRLKSGRYSVERPLELGARLAGVGPERLAALRRYGAAAGEAFQLQDDILGVFGDPERVGKPVGSDLREGKTTFLVRRALERADPARRRRLAGVLGDRRADPQDIEEAADIIRSSGGLDAVRAMVEERLDTARRALEGIALRPEGERFLLDLLDHLRERKR